MSLIFEHEDEDGNGENISRLGLLWMVLGVLALNVWWRILDLLPRVDVERAGLVTGKPELMG